MNFTTLDLGVQAVPIASFDTSFASAGSDPFGVIDYPVAPIGSTLTLDPFLFPESSVGSNSLFALEPDPNGLLMPVQPAPQQATAGTPSGNTWAPLLGFGAPIVGAEISNLLKTGQLQPGLLQYTGANGASVGVKGAGQPLRTFLDTTNHGVTGMHLVVGGVALLALLYGINKFT